MMDLRELQTHFSKLRETIQRAVAVMSEHTQFIEQHVAAPPMPGQAG